MNRFYWCLFGVSVCVATIGCADDRVPLYPVSGVISFDSGDPVRNATIEFSPLVDGPAPRGLSDDQGRFTLSTFEPGDGAPAGDYRVIVVQSLPPRAAQNVYRLGKEHAEHAGKIPVVALRHASPETSGLTHTVEPVAADDVAIVVESR